MATDPSLTLLLDIEATMLKPHFFRLSYAGSQDSYSPETMRIILDRYLIQIMNSVEGEIFTIDRNHIFYDTLAGWLIDRYHPKYRPLEQPIDALKALIDDSVEYTLIMVSL